MRQNMRERLTHYLILLVLVIVMNFFLPRWMPGSPVKTIMGEDVGSMTAAEKMGILEAYNLDKPLGEQFLLYLRDLFTLNWGDSYAKRQPILDLIASRIGWTLLLAGGNLVLSTILGTFLGIRGAFGRRRGRGAGTLVASAAVTSLPRRSSSSEDYHGICRFPARFFYLHSLLDFEELPRVECQEFKAIRRIHSWN